MKPSKIILASAHRYGDPIRLGTSYLAEALARRGWRVLFLEQPTSPFHLLSARSRATALEKLRATCREILRPPVPETSTANPVVLNVVTALPHVAFPIFDSAVTLRNWWRLTFPSLAGSVRNMGFGPTDFILFDTPSFFPFARSMRMRSIYRYADRLKEFSEVTKAMIDLQDVIFREADLIAYTARTLEKDMIREGRSFYLPNGVDGEAFASQVPEPPELASIPRPRVVYSGAFGPWFDFDLLSAASEAMPDYHFVLIGPAGTAEAALGKRPNVHFLGQQWSSRVPQFLLHCQAAIIPFDRSRYPELTDAINPLKLYEYCAAGLPVICYPSEEISALGAPVEFYSSLEEFIGLLRGAIGEDGVERIRRRKAWAGEATWDKRAALLEQEIEKNRTQTGVA